MYNQYKAIVISSFGAMEEKQGKNERRKQKVVQVTARRKKKRLMKCLKH